MNKPLVKNEHIVKVTDKKRFDIDVWYLLSLKYFFEIFVTASTYLCKTNDDSFIEIRSNLK